MNLDFTSDKPIYLQIADSLEDAIFTSVYAEEEQVPSTTELSVSLKINPATVLKGMSLLVEEDILYKKRGIGMFVKSGARDKILKKRQSTFQRLYIKPLLEEAKKLGLSKEEIKDLIERG